MPFEGLRVLSLESRRAREMHTMINREGGIPFVAPSVKERAVDDSELAVRLVEQMERGEFDMVICMTATGLALLRETCSTRITIERLSVALRRVTIVSRGPKPVAVLRSLGVPIAVMIPEPNTWREIVAAVAARPERRIAVLEFGRPSAPMNAALQLLGARVTPVALYRWELPDNLDLLQAAVTRICNGECDVVLFTSSVQLDHLLSVARKMNAEQEVRFALTNRLVVASIGPIMSEALEAEGVAPDIVPRTPKMWALVKAAAGESGAILAKKRRVLTLTLGQRITTASPFK